MCHNGARHWMVDMRFQHRRQPHAHIGVHIRQRVHRRHIQRLRHQCALTIQRNGPRRCQRFHLARAPQCRSVPLYRALPAQQVQPHGQRPGATRSQYQQRQTAVQPIVQRLVADGGQQQPDRHAQDGDHQRVKSRRALCPPHHRAFAIVRGGGELAAKALHPLLQQIRPDAVQPARQRSLHGVTGQKGQH